MNSITDITQYFFDLQKNIHNELNHITQDTSQQSPLHWENYQGHITHWENQPCFEKATISVSHIAGQSLPKASLDHASELKEIINQPYEATGISMIFHPRNPHVPTMHANLRYFQCQDTWWFGGGMDLTPYYGYREDAIHWHQSCQTACSASTPNPYPWFKTQCDDYFYLKHRQEHRGIGGLFFDKLYEPSFESCTKLIQSIGDNLTKAYAPIVSRRQNTPYTQEQTEFQHYRRGRYVEFNLLQDRGTLFGLQSGHRTENILVSMPPKVAWKYGYQPQQNTPEAKLIETFLSPKDWIKETL
ncbi:MAG TPA: oxygen-dependent coproporphyrinogen oxidase [Gammaproteobacteria bacterium]|nr:oxygen-dependent coproporphyrinogen oxidase [Gammaproteobacteria bacterium]